MGKHFLKRTFSVPNDKSTIMILFFLESYIMNHPQHGIQTLGNFLQKLPKKFPYLAFFTVTIILTMVFISHF